MTKKQRSSCPINFALEVFGDPWSLMIIRDIAFNKKTTYGEFLTSAEGISTKILAKRLAHLVDEGVLNKVRSSSNGRIIDYTLTPKGKALIPILHQMLVWGVDYGAPNPALHPWVEAIRANPQKAFEETLHTLP